MLMPQESVGQPISGEVYLGLYKQTDMMLIHSTKIST